MLGVEISKLLTIEPDVSKCDQKWLEDLLFLSLSTFWDSKCNAKVMRFGAPLMLFNGETRQRFKNHQESMLNCLPGCFAFLPFPSELKLGNMEHRHLRYDRGTFAICALRKRLKAVQLRL